MIVAQRLAAKTKRAFKCSASFFQAAQSRETHRKVIRRYNQQRVPAAKVVLQHRQLLSKSGRRVSKAPLFVADISQVVK